MKALSGGERVTLTLLVKRLRTVSLRLLVLCHTVTLPRTVVYSVLSFYE